LTIPRNTSLQEAQQFLQSKISWIKKQLQRIEQYNKLKDHPVSNIDIEKAQRDLFDRLDYFSKKYNFSYNRASFRNQKTKWGSFSRKNNINLNINIVYLPTYLQDYILLHELCHLRYKNHSKQFWEELDKYIDGRAKVLSKELRGYRMRLI